MIAQARRKNDKQLAGPTLTTLQFKFAFDSEYLEDFVARVDTPLLQRIKILFFIWHPQCAWMTECLP
jgi:hypothetical protein